MGVADMRQVKRRFGVTMNDVVLATVSGALHRYLARHRALSMEQEVRAAVPVSMRDPSSFLGNQVSLWLLPLPADERDPERRLAAVREATAERKESGNARALYSLLKFADGIAPTALRSVRRLLHTDRPTSTIPCPDLRCSRCEGKTPAAALCSLNCSRKSTEGSTIPFVPIAKKAVRRMTATRTFLPARIPVQVKSIFQGLRCTKIFFPRYFAQFR